MRISPEESSASIVIVGSFNPAIFHPSWLFHRGIESPVPQEYVQVEVCHNDISRFSVNNTQYHIDSDRFQIQTSVAPWITIFDKVALIFGQYLHETPLKAVGINKDIHFRARDAATRMKVGRTLAPIAPWGAFGQEMDNQPKDLVGGLLSLTMRSHEVTDTFKLAKNVKLEPSARLKNDGIYMQINFHFEPSKLDENKGPRQIMDLIGEQFEPRMQESDRLFDAIMEIAS